MARFISAGIETVIVTVAFLDGLAFLKAGIFCLNYWGKGIHAV